MQVRDTFSIVESNALFYQCAETKMIDKLYAKKIQEDDKRVSPLKDQIDLKQMMESNEKRKVPTHRIAI